METDSMMSQGISFKTAIGGLPVECFIASDQHIIKNRHFSEEHSHASYELLICKSGSGYQFINDKGHRYNDNTVFVFAPFISHAHIADNDMDELRYSIKFEIPNLKEASSDLHIDPAVDIAIKFLSNEGYFQVAADKNLTLAIDILTEILKGDNSYRELLLSGTLSMILALVCREINISLGESDLNSIKSFSTGNINDRKFQIDYFFDQMINDNARMEDLCQQVHLSPSQLNRTIKELYGTTFKQKLIDVRIAYIKYFLKYSNLSISEIAEKTNFSSDNSFSLFFKKHCGMSPGQYRKQVRM